MKFEVIVSNIGKVHEGEDKKEAVRFYQDYVGLSMAGIGRAAGEEVHLLRDGEPIKTHTPLDLWHRIHSWATNHPAECAAIVSYCARKLLLDESLVELGPDDDFMSGADFIDEFVNVLRSSGMLKGIKSNLDR